jgi:hypothetical protein
MKAWPSALFMAAALLIAPLALTGCDQKADTKETKVIKEPAPAPVHDTTIIRELAPAPAPVINETRINETRINESRTNETNIVNAPKIHETNTNATTTIIEKNH